MYQECDLQRDVDVQTIQRAKAILERDGMLSTRYATLAVEAGLVDAEDRRGCRNARGRLRWYLA